MSLLFLCFQDFITQKTLTGAQQRLLLIRPWYKEEDSDWTRYGECYLCLDVIWPCCSSSLRAERSSFRSVSTGSCTDRPGTTLRAGARSAAAASLEDHATGRTAAGTTWTPSAHTRPDTLSILLAHSWNTETHEKSLMKHHHTLTQTLQ